MKISELLKKEAVKLNTSASDKNDAIDQLIELHYTAGNVTDKAVFKKAILAREEEGTTGMGNGIICKPVQAESPDCICRLQQTATGWFHEGHMRSWGSWQKV